MSVWVMPSAIDVYENFLKRSQAVARGRRRWAPPNKDSIQKLCQCHGYLRISRVNATDIDRSLAQDIWYTTWQMSHVTGLWVPHALPFSPFFWVSLQMQPEQKEMECPTILTYWGLGRCCWGGPCTRTVHLTFIYNALLLIELTYRLFLTQSDLCKGWRRRPVLPFLLYFNWTEANTHNVMLW